MKLLIAFCLLAVIGSYAAIRIKWWPMRLLCLFVAANFAFGAIAYAFRIPQFWGKRGDGRLDVVRRVAFLPLHGFNELLFQYNRLRTSSRPFDEILPGIYLGRRLTGSEGNLKEFKTVLDMTSEFTEPTALRQASSYHCVPVLDLTPPSAVQLREAVDFLSAHQTNGPVLVHCAAGHGRSALVMAAFLLDQKRATNADDAVSQLKRSRPNVALNRAQRASLESFAQSTATNHVR